jgi:Putative adhesin
MHGTALTQTETKPATALPLTRGRRVALAIGVPLCLALTANTGLSIVANVGRGTVPLSYRVPVTAGRVTVTASGGNVVLRQGSGRQASLVGTGSYSLVRPDVTERLAGGGAQFGYSCPVPEGTCELNATLSVPAGTAVSVSTGGGSVSASGVSGDLALSTGGGGIQATGVAAAQVTADTGGGGISIVFTQVPRDVHVSTGGGDITIVVPPGNAQYNVHANTDGGNPSVSVPANSTSRNVITATTGGGGITIRPGTSLH